MAGWRERGPLGWVVGAAGGQHDPGVVGKARQQQPHQQVVGEVVDREGDLHPVDAAPVGVPGAAGVEHQRVDGGCAQPLADCGGEGSHAVLVGQVQRQRFGSRRPWAACPQQEPGARCGQ